MSTIYGEFIYHLNQYQQILNSLIASSFREIDTNGFYGSLFIIGIAFVYGVVHAIGPGHGKAVVAGYFISQKRTLLSVFKMGYSVAIIHTLSAFILTFGLYYLVEGIFSRNFDKSVDLMYNISGGMILLVGLYLVYELYRDWNVNNFSDSNETLPQKKHFVVALSVGIVPCPGVMTILLFSLMLGHLTTGILATIAMSIGMGLTISISAIMAQKSRNLGNKSRFIAKTLQILSPIIVIFIGLFLLLS
jgi:ABC-type nickel/cobalt efflux system permease component RcnA